MLLENITSSQRKVSLHCHMTVGFSHDGEQVSCEKPQLLITHDREDGNLVICPILPLLRLSIAAYPELLNREQLLIQV